MATVRGALSPSPVPLPPQESRKSKFFRSERSRPLKKATCAALYINTNIRYPVERVCNYTASSSYLTKSTISHIFSSFCVVLYKYISLISRRRAALAGHGEPSAEPSGGLAAVGSGAVLLSIVVYLTGSKKIGFRPVKLDFQERFTTQDQPTPPPSHRPDNALHHPAQPWRVNSEVGRLD